MLRIAGLTEPTAAEEGREADSAAVSADVRPLRVRLRPTGLTLSRTAELLDSPPSLSLSLSFSPRRKGQRERERRSERTRERRRDREILRFHRVGFFRHRSFSHDHR